MKNLYLFNGLVIASGALLDCVTPLVKAGQILIVSNIAGYHDNIATTEEVTFYIKDYSTKIYLKSGKPDVANKVVSWQGRAILPQGWCVGVTAAAAAATEQIYLSVIGELYDLATYKKLNLV